MIYDFVIGLYDQELNELLTLSSASRESLTEFIRTHVKIRPGDEKRWDTEVLPLIRKMCASLEVSMEDGDLHLHCNDTSLEGVLVSCSRGTSWYSSVNMIEAVAQAMLLKT